MKFFGNDLNVPNGYIYTSHTGSKYIFLEGLWFSHNDMKMIDPRKYTNMYESAQKQIFENDSMSKVDSTYIVEDEKEKTDDINKDDENIDIPDGFVYTSPQNKQYFKKKGVWYSSATKKPLNASNIPLINRAATAQIKSMNSTSPVKIGQEWTAKSGKTYKYVGGNRFISDEGRMLPPDLSQKVMSNLQQNSQSEKEQPEEQPQVQNTNQEVEQNSVSQPNDNDKNEPVKSTSEDENNPLQALANQIKSSPSSRNIQVLLTRGDPISLLAADILLSGESDKAKQIIQSLNKEG